MNGNKDKKMIFHLAPLQGYTNKAYRLVYDDVFGGFSHYYTPYLSLNNDHSISNRGDVFIDNTNSIFQRTIPQLLPASLEELKKLLSLEKLNEFCTLNLNLGCPYPMVTNKGRGAGLIRKPEVVTEMIRYIQLETNWKVGLKTRIGLEIGDELGRFLESIPVDDLDHLIVHPRTATQLYTGKADVKIVAQLKKDFPEIKMVYNGDINSFDDFQLKNEILENQTEWMIGRGVLKNPFLLEQIVNNTGSLDSDYAQRLYQFCISLIAEIEKNSSDKGHALNQIKYQLVYLFDGFPEYKRLRKSIKKSKKIDDVMVFLEVLNS